MTVILPPALDIPTTQPFTKDVLDKAFAYIVQRFLLIEAFKPQYQDAVDQLNRFGLARLNDAIQPIYDRLAAIAQIGVIFTASSGSSVAAQTGAATFVVSLDDRARFAPAGYIVAQATVNTNVILTGHTTGYDRDTGSLRMLVEQVAGGLTGTFSSWRISPAVTPNFLATAHSVGAYTQGETDAAIATLGSTILGNAPAGRQTLKALNDQIVAQASTIAAITGGADPTLDSFAEALTRFLNDEGQIASLFTQVGNRLRFDAAQGLSPTQKTQGLSNLGAQRDLGYTPVQQAGGGNQLANKLYLGWDGGAPRLQVDSTDIGRLWNDSYAPVSVPKFFSTAGGDTSDLTNQSRTELSIDFVAGGSGALVIGAGSVNAGSSSGSPDIVWTVQVVDVANGSLLASRDVGATAIMGAGYSGPVAPHLVTASLTRGRTYRARLLCRKEQLIGPIYPGLMALDVCNW